MEAMTPEERFLKIENALAALTESQVRNDAQIEKQNAGIRDLIVVSRSVIDSQRSVIDSQKENADHIQKLEQMQDATFRAIDRLTENIDKLLRGPSPNGNQ